MLYLNISQQNAKIELTTTKPILNLRTTRPQLQIDSAPATLEIRQARGEMEIDQTPCRYSIGLKNMMDFAVDNAQEGRRTVLETIGRIAEEGDRMAHIETKENVIPNLASEHSIQQPPDITLERIAAPIIKYNAQPLQIDVIPAKLNLELQRGTVDAELERGTVDIRMAQYQSLKFWITENQYDIRT